MDQEQVLKQLDSKVTKSTFANLAAAYVKARKNVTHTRKNANNPHFGNDYATLDAVLDSFTEAFADQDLALLQAPGEIVGDKASLVGMLLHGPSGEALSFRMEIPMGKGTAQAYGSAITYARRYQAAAVAGISQVDDDGEAASAPPRNENKKASKKDPSYAATVQSLLEDIEKMSKETYESLRSRVSELGDSKVIDAFQAKRNELAKKKAAA